ncbi:hypothetical protein ACIA74_40065 [Streptomyces sp. NPDC051658]|uniref:hypothetical protein n=1 Tax=Streptomyces sp. NPDC051658 TaxID=3365667 RepID=UPI003795064A
MLKEELDRGPAARGFEDQRWTPGRVQVVIARRFRVNVFRTESPWQAIAWSVVLIGTVAFVAALIRAELLLRRLGRQADGDASET